MAKDRNTFAKRQREVEKKRKADDKRERRARKKMQADEAQTMSAFQLSSSEQAVLAVFRKYLMLPGKMLCLSKADLESFSRPLAELTSKRLLVAERFQGGYSLTETGFAAMQDAE